MNKQHPVKDRIPDKRTASRCLKNIMEYLRTHENPLTAEDMAYSIQVLLKHERTLLLNQLDKELNWNIQRDVQNVTTK